jgi:hypothetical protein
MVKACFAVQEGEVIIRPFGLVMVVFEVLKFFDVLYQLDVLTSDFLGFLLNVCCFVGYLS